MDESKEQKAGLKFLFIIATKEVLNCEVKFCHSLDTGMRGIFLTRKKVDYNDIKEITKPENDTVPLPDDEYVPTAVIY